MTLRGFILRVVSRFFFYLLFLGTPKQVTTRGERCYDSWGNRL
jgi:hypothetical protein